MFLSRQQFRIALLLLGLFASTLSWGGAPQWVVIANRGVQAGHISSTQLKKLFLGRSRRVNGQRILAFNQPDDTRLFQNFYREVTGWNHRQVTSYWSRMVLSGKANQPATINSRHVVEMIAHTPMGVAYVSQKALDAAPLKSNVKVLYRSTHVVKKRQYGLNLSKESKHGLTLPLPAADKPAHQGAVNLSSPAPRAFLQHPSINVAHKQKRIVPNQVKTKEENVPVIDQHRNLWSQIVRHYGITDYRHGPVARQVKWFLSHPKTMQTMLRNSIPYLAYVYQQTQRAHLPSEFALLPMLESGYNPYAYSKVGAAGLWQMMPQTATLYGLNITWWYDPRRDILLSTQSALDYLSHLHQQLKNWELTASAYNAGASVIQRAIKLNQQAQQPADFWHLHLPAETQAYLPKLLALAYIIKYPNHYHVTLPELSKVPFFTSVTLSSQMSLRAMAELSGVSVNLIHYLNPGLRRYATMPEHHYTLLIPTLRLSSFQARYKKWVGRTYVSWLFHEVYPGETFLKIARNYKTKPATLQYVNNLEGFHVVAGQGLLVPVHLKKEYRPILNVGESKQEGSVPLPHQRSPVGQGIALLNNVDPSVNLSGHRHYFHVETTQSQSQSQKPERREAHPTASIKQNKTPPAEAPKKVGPQPVVVDNPVLKLMSNVFYNINLLR